MYGVRRARYPQQVGRDTPSGQDIGLKFMKEIEDKIIKKLGKHFDQDGWQRAAKKAASAAASAPASAPVSAPVPAAALAHAARPASASAPGSRPPLDKGVAQDKDEPSGDPEAFATWVRQKMKKMPTNDHTVKM